MQLNAVTNKKTRYQHHAYKVTKSNHCGYKEYAHIEALAGDILKSEVKSIVENIDHIRRYTTFWFGAINNYKISLPNGPNKAIFNIPAEIYKIAVVGDAVLQSERI